FYYYSNTTTQLHHLRFTLPTTPTTTMKSFATALLIGAAAATSVTVTNYHYVGVNGYPAMGFFLSADDVQCSADRYIPGVAYKCSDPAWTFVVDADAPAEGNSFTLR
ncbi:hypothetical protein, partial [Acinetobacter baumannii]|uniref:hypothetical protein n=1 Tax=Acinetobacter baumannii TaxID=470 RepID=UPI00148A160F